MFSWLRWLADASLADSIAGDLEEQRRRRATRSRVAARAWFWRRSAAIAAYLLAQKVRSWGAEPTRIMGDWGPEVRFVLRGLRRTPVFSITIVFTLMLGLGLTSAIFAFADGYLFRPLPFPGADQTYIVSAPGDDLRETDTDALRHSAVAELGFVEWTMSYRMRNFRIVIDDRRVDFYVEAVSPGFRKTLALPLVAGRDFVADDHRPGDPVPVWLTHAFWMREFGGDRGVVGRTFAVDAASPAQHVVVAGILGPTVASFNGANEPPAAIAPAVPPTSPDPKRYSRPIVRLPNGMSAGQGTALIAHALNIVAPSPGGTPRTVQLRSLYERQVAGGRPTATVLFIGAMLVLLLAAITMVHLLLARGVARANEIATRAALGASQWRVTRLFLTEGLLLAVAGISGGLLVGVWLARLIESSIPMFPTSGRNLTLVPMVFDSRVIVFATVLGLVVSCAGALWPARRALGRSLAIGGRSSAGLSAAIPMRLSRAILASELAVATIVMAGTVFIGSGIWRYLHQPLGFDYVDRYRMSVVTPGDRPLTPLERDAARRALLDAHGVNAVAWDGYTSVGGLEVPGRAVNMKDTVAHEAAPGFFEAWNLRLKAGRWFSAQEYAGNEPVAVVDENLARLAWPDSAAVGQDIRIAGVTRRVIGVIEPKRGSLQREWPGQAYVQATPSLDFASAIVWAPRASAADVTRIAAAAAAAVPGSKVETRPVTLDSLYMRETGEANFQGPIVASFGVLAFLLAGIGVFGLVSYLVEQRTREFGIRFALGARPSDVWRNVTAESVRPAIAGLVIGLGCARALEAVVQASVFGWKSSAPLAILSVAVALVAVAVLAAIVPARRAMRIDPAITLRME